MEAYTDSHYHQRWATPTHILDQQQQQNQQQQYSQFYSTSDSSQSQSQQQQQQQQQGGAASQSVSSSPTDHRTTSLSLNLSSLSVASPTNLSPITGPSSNSVAAAAAAAVSPVTPISPSGNPFQHHPVHNTHPHAAHQQHSHSQLHHQGHGHTHVPFGFDHSPPSHQQQQQQQQHTQSGYEDVAMQERRTPVTSQNRGTPSSATPGQNTNSGAAGSGPIPRKRSFTAHPNASSTSLNNASTGSVNLPMLNMAALGTPGGAANNNANGAPNGNAGASSTNGTGGANSLNLNVNIGSPLVEESGMYDDESRDAAMELASAGAYDELSAAAHGLGGANHGGHVHAHGQASAGGGSPVDGSGSTSGAEDSFGMSMGLGSGGGPASASGVGASMNILGKPLATNNFVTKLYQMINDPKSAQFIAWTELGTSFVVSNVGEFSRSILGSHFKHNNTPRAQRTSTDAQTWEFSHHKFLRGRADLLDEIKRKALEPDVTVGKRVELPGEVAAQLGAMREENRRMWDQLNAEKRKVEKLVNVVTRLWDVVGKGFPGSVPQFPSELLESSDSPNIYVTSPTATSRYPPPLSMNMHGMHSLNSPNSSPTATDFPSHHHHHNHHQNHHGHPHSLSRQHSFQHVAGYGRGDSTSSTPLPSSPGSMTMDLFDDGSCDPPPPSGRSSTKRQRIDEGGIGINVNVNGMGGTDGLALISSVSSPGTGPSGSGQGGLANLTVPKKSSRARSDSAPMGYHTSQTASGLGLGWSTGAGGLNGAGAHGIVGRPRSGSGMMPRMGGIPNIGNMTRGNNASTPLLSITTAEAELGR
ncbi:hypothetical protein CVT24_005821 [Panaeolus cyanescens]|uniref:HSF-type DNA-binding domain-containing protein n=1 Tax=Panaeolus cyanescens TaxID=181874 RepID=A0A409VDK8_9AGAR|nr:hypothetical protein CVT24_005821 [Panaeolus cyanescens]